MAYGKCVSYYHSGLLESLTHRLSELGVVWNAVESHPLLQHIRNQGAKKVSNSPLRTRRSGRAAHWAAGLDWRPGLLVGSSVLSYLPRDFPLRHRGGVIASTPPPLFWGAPRAMLTGRHGLSEFACAGGRLPRALALERECSGEGWVQNPGTRPKVEAEAGMSTVGTEDALIQTTHRPASFTGACAVTRDPVFGLMLCCCPLQILTKFLNKGPHIFISHRPP